MLQDLLVPIWFLNAHIFYRYEKYMYISIQQNQKRQHRGIWKGKGRIIIRVTIYINTCIQNLKNMLLIIKIT